MTKPTSTASRKPDRRLDALSALRAEPKSLAASEKLRSALAGPANYLAAKAASIAGDLGYQEFTADLVAAFHRCLQDAAKSDPQCWAKNAIARALRELSYDEPELFSAGAKHVQMEPVWGGQRDTAAELRSICLHALVSCRGLRDLELLRMLVDGLTDPEKLVRCNAAQAMGQVPREETALLLRLKILSGDKDPEVIGDCFSALLRNEPKEGVALVGRYLNPAGSDLAFEAAAALGECREPQALELLKQAFQSAISHDLRAATLRSIGATRQPAAVDFLIDLINTRQSAREAIVALSPLRGNQELRARVEAAVRSTGSQLLAESFHKEFAGR